MKNEKNSKKRNQEKLEEQKNKSKITIDSIGFIVIILTIVMLNIFIGSNIKDPIWIIQTIVSIFTLIYLIVKKIQKENNLIIKGKIDIAVHVFMISTMLPLIFNTYVSLEGTINFILKYWSVYGLYILTRNIVKDKDKIKVIIKTIIFSSIIPIIFGFDKFTVNIFEPVYKFLNSVNIEDIRMISTFGYANTLAAYLSFTICLAIGRIINTPKKKNKILYGIYIEVSAVTILLTQSKFVLAIDALIIIGFIIAGIKNKKIGKRWIIAGSIAIVAFFIYFFIAIQISEPLVVTEEEKTCVIRGIESNKEYELEFDMQTQTDKTYDVFEVSIVEVNRYFAENYLANFTLGNFTGTKTLQIQTGEQVDHIEIRIKNSLNKKITINEFRIDDKPYILEYKIIPEPLVRIFTTFNFKNSSVWQRVDYWKDGIDIIKDNWLIGAGGNTWRTLYGQTQDYLYYAKEAHCYILEIWMSFGIVGILSYLFIIAITIQNAIEVLKKSKQEDKNKYINYITIAFGIGIIVIHSLMDFDMSYLIIEMLVFMCIAMLNKEDNKLSIQVKGTTIFAIIMFLTIWICNILGLIADIIEDDTGIGSNKIAPWVSRYKYNRIVYLENNQLERENKIAYIKKYMQEEPYNYQNTMYKMMSEDIIKNITADNLENELENIEYLINVWYTIKTDRPYDVNGLQDRAEIMLNFSENLMEKAQNLNAEELKDKAKEILELIEIEYNENIEKSFDMLKAQEGKTIMNYKKEYYQNVYEKAKQLLEK